VHDLARSPAASGNQRGSPRNTAAGVTKPRSIGTLRRAQLDFGSAAHVLGIWQADGPRHQEEPKMGEIKDKTRNAAQELTGKAKEAAGKSTGNRKLESKGKADQTKAKVKKTGEKVKDVFR
jgi:uncharacterized protein YjbJ (UPF0337 family)